MSNSRWSSSSDGSIWRSASRIFSHAPAAKPEEIQIVLMGAPRTGKTRLHSRYTLHQFVDIESEGAKRMGGHKHLYVPDGTDVHLIIHELRTAHRRGATENLASEDRARESWHRRRLLEQSDAVMLAFDPSSHATYEWINSTVVNDVLDARHRKQVTTEIDGPLDDPAAAMPTRMVSTRSAMAFKSLRERLPRWSEKDESDHSDAASIFGEDVEAAENRIGYRGGLKRISIMVEDAAPKEAEFVMHENDLPFSAPPSFISSPQASNSKSTRTMLPAIRESEECAEKHKRTAMVVDKTHLPVVKHGSIVRFQSPSSSSSVYSESSSPAFGDTSPGDRVCEVAHPILRGNDKITDVVAEVGPERLNPQRAATYSPIEETRLPVLIVATMADKLVDTGGALARRVTAGKGQRLARMFGANSAYIETSAKTNANVDEAFGIIIDQVMAKRAAAKRKELARARVEAADAVVPAEARPPGPAMRPPSRVAARGCSPLWPWLQGFLVRVPSWESVSTKFSEVFHKTGVQQSGDESTVDGTEDVWGEQVVKSPQHKARHSEAISHHLTSDNRDPSLRSHLHRQSHEPQRARSGIGSRAMSHTPTRETLCNILERVPGQEESQLAPQRTTVGMERQTRTEMVIPDLPDAFYNPGEKGKFQRPMSVLTITPLESRKSDDSEKQLRKSEVLGSLKRKPAQHGHIVNSNFFRLTRSGLNGEPTCPSNKHKSTWMSSVTNPTRVSDEAPRIPPLEFDAIIIDNDKRASVSVIVRSAGLERNEATMEHFPTHDATRNSHVIISSPASEDIPPLAPLPGGLYDSVTEELLKRVTAPEVPALELSASDEDKEEFLTVMAYGLGSEKDSAMALGLADGAATVADQRPVYVILDEPAVQPARPEQTLTSSKKLPTPQQAVKTGPAPPRQQSTMRAELPTAPLASIPERGLATPPPAAFVTPSSNKDRMAVVPMVIKGQFRGSDGSEDMQLQQRPVPQRPRALPDRRWAMPRMRDGKGPMMVQLVTPAPRQ
ncbi:unnamed protein product [Discula destructiva]